MLSADGHVPVRVRGFAVGWVQFDSDRRHVFGTFEHTFRVKAKGRHVVTVGGLLGRDERVLSFEPHHDLVVPKPRLNGEAVARAFEPTLSAKSLRCAPRGVQARIRLSFGRTNIEVPSENSHE